MADYSAQLTMHGRGQGDDAPLVTNGRSTERNRDYQLYRANAFILKPTVWTSDRQTSILRGDTVAIRPNGAFRLGKREHPIYVTPE